MFRNATVLALLLSNSALAADILVPSGGSIQGAINAALNGDRILVQAGTYHQTIDLHGKLLELRALSGPTATVIDGTGLLQSVVRADGGEPLGTKIAGFTLRGGDGLLFTNGSQGPYLYGGGMFVGNGSTLRAENCVFDANGYTGPSHTGSDFGGGVYVGRAGSFCELYRCVLQNNFAFIDGGAGFVDSDGTLRLENCSMWGNYSGDQVTSPGGFAVGPNAALEILNTISWNNQGPEIAFLPGPGNGASVSVTYSDMQGGYAGTGNIDADPAYVNAGMGDLHITSTSPCIDAGNPASPQDPDSTRVDIGAHPYLAPPSIVSYCPGDGSGTACPCGNNAMSGSGTGCRNSTGAGALLYVTGTPSLSNDTVTLQAVGTPPFASGLFFQGTASLGTGNGIVFGDGLRCAGGSVRRLAIRTASAGVSTFGYANPSDPGVSFAGAVQPNGATLFYQLWYRDAATFCTAFTFNLTNGVRVTWAP